MLLIAVQLALSVTSESNATPDITWSVTITNVATCLANGGDTLHAILQRQDLPTTVTVASIIWIDRKLNAEGVMHCPITSWREIAAMIIGDTGTVAVKSITRRHNVQGDFRDFINYCCTLMHHMHSLRSYHT